MTIRKARAWFRKHNLRRHELINREVEGTITQPEADELARLQQRAHEVIKAAFPAPDYTRLKVDGQELFL